MTRYLVTPNQFGGQSHVTGEGVDGVGPIDNPWLFQFELFSSVLEGRPAIGHYFLNPSVPEP